MKTFDPTAHALSINRRSFLTQSAYGLGGLALAMMHHKLAAAGAGGCVAVTTAVGAAVDLGVGADPPPNNARNSTA